MPYVLILFVAIAVTLVATHRNNRDLVTPRPHQQQANFDAMTFLAYRGAVLAYVGSNPSFVGTISSSNLQGQYPPAFLSSAGNYVSSVGLNGRLITSFANLSSGAAYTAMVVAGVDASIGISNGSSWISVAPDANKNTIPLNTPVPSGYAVSVVQIGA